MNHMLFTATRRFHPLVLAALLVPLTAKTGLALAQANEASAATPAPEPSAEPAAKPPEPVAPPVDNPALHQPDSTDQRFKALEEKLSAQSARIDTLEQELTQANEQLAAPASGSSDEQHLSAWGFMDVNFGKVFLDNSQGVYAVRVPTKSTFLMNGINLYLKGTLTPTLSTLFETRLTFTPVGYEHEQQVDAYVGNTLIQSSGSYRRGGETVRAPLSQMPYRQNGILIERAHVDWRPLDWLIVRAGRYLTPYGIWNEDHGSPVLLGADNPNLINWELVPTRQTGLQILGSRELADSLTFDYAATLSNGRGPIDEYKDLDSNKGVGLRLKLVYATDDVTLRVGGYGYRGTYTDSRNREYVHLRPDLTLDTSYPAAFGAAELIQVAYNENTLALDALVRFKGFKVFGEYARRRVIYTHAPRLDSEDSLLNGIPVSVPLYSAGYIGFAYYVMGAYEIDASRLIDGVKVTPYVGYDAIRPNDTVRTENMKQYRVGLNVKPSPWVTTKFELVRIVPDAAALGSKAWAAFTQLAVAF